MKDILNLFKRDAEFDQEHVDDHSESNMFAKRRVLESSTKGEFGEGAGESTATKAKRKAGSLGFKKQEDSVWGRR
jgi:hypothetical protein